MSVIARNGTRYLATCVDLHTQLCVTQALETKDQTAQATMHVIGRLEAETGHQFKVAIARMDKGGEFDNIMLERFMSRRGIKREFTNTDCPHQNGAAERIGGMVKDTSRTMHILAGAPMDLWHESTAYANWTRNRVPTRRQRGMTTPYHMLAQRSTDEIERARVWGCRAFVRVLDKHRKTCDPKGIAGVFIGMAKEEKGCRVLLQDGRVVESSDVTFDESVMPFRKEKTLADDVANDLIRRAVTVSEVEVASQNFMPRELGSLANLTRCTENERVQTAQSTDCDDWKKAELEELVGIKEAGTYRLVPRPRGKQVIPTRFTYVRKTDQNGKVVRHKARLVAKGCCDKRTREPGWRTFAPTLKLSSIRMIYGVSEWGHDR